MIGESLPSMSEWTGCWAYSNNACGTCAIYPNAPQITGLTIAASDWPDNYSFHSNHVNGLQFALADGSVHFINANVSQLTWFAVCTPAAGDNPGNDY